MTQENMFDAEFYPTSKDLIDKLIEPFRKDLGHLTILEPSAGKGDILDYILEITRNHYRPKLYCIEKDKNLQHILREKDYRVISEDFLNYNGDYYFDLILMNPPFSNGDAHLLKAWEILKEGDIACLLNKETYFNPYSEKRKLLKSIIDEHGSIEDLGKCFMFDVERKAHCEVILVRLHKEPKEDVFGFNFKAVNSEDKFELNEDSFKDTMILRDVIGNMETQYKKVKLAFIEHLKALEGLDFYKTGLLTPHVEIEALKGYKRKEAKKKYNEFCDFMKLEIWRKVITEMKMDRYMTHKVQENFQKFIDQQGAMDFTRENVFSMINMLFANKENILKQAVIDVFDIFTKYHDENRLHVEGWKTNDMWKVNRKVILPYWVKYGEYMNQWDIKQYGDDFDIDWNKQSQYADIDKVMCYLTGFNYESCRTLYDSLHRCITDVGKIRPGEKFDNTGESTFFTFRFFKKGTLHIEFKDKDLWERFNLAACEGKNWLPKGSYRKKEASRTGEASLMRVA